MFATWLGITTVGAVVATGRYEMALALEREGDPRRIAAVATLIIIGIVGIALAVGAAGLWIFTSRLAAQGALIATFAPTVCMLAVAQVWQCWAAAERRFGDVATMRIVQSVGITFLQIVLGLFWPTAFSLAIAHLAGALLGVLMGIQRMPLSLVPPTTGEPWRVALISYWRRHRQFPVFSLAADTINSSAAQLPLVIVNIRFGAHEAGLLAIVLRALGAPISLLAASVLDVFRPRAAQSWRDLGECREDYVRTFRVLAIGAAGVGLTFGLFSDSLFATAFGEQWRMAGSIALWLLPMFMLRFVASPLSYLFYVAGKQQVDLIWQIALFATTVSALALPATYKAALISYSAGYSTLYVVYLLLSYRYSRGSS